MLAGDGLASVEGIAASLNRQKRLEMFAGDALASVEGIEAPLNRQKRLECLLATVWRRLKVLQRRQTVFPEVL